MRRGGYLLGVGLLFACRADNPEFDPASSIAGNTERLETGEASGEVGEGDGDPGDTATDPGGDGDGEPMSDGDGEPVGDGDGEPAGDGDGEPAGDGDGEPAGDGDGEPAGDGDGEPTGDGDGDESTQTGEPDVCDFPTGIFTEQCNGSEDCPPDSECILLNDPGLPQPYPSYCTQTCETEEQCAWGPDDMCFDDQMACFPLGQGGDFAICVLQCNDESDCYPGQECSPVLGVCFVP